MYLFIYILSKKIKITKSHKNKTKKETYNDNNRRHKFPMCVCVCVERNENVDELNAMHVGNDTCCIIFWALMLILCIFVHSHSASAVGAAVHILPAVSSLILPMSGTLSTIHLGH